MSRRLRTCVLLLLVVGAVGTSPTASAQDLLSFHRLVTGVATLFVSTCPFETLPPPETECLDTLIVYGQEGSPSEHVRRLPWTVIVFERRFMFHGEDVPDTTIHTRFGLLENASGFVDTTHLLTASLSATVAMDDSSTFAVSLDWDMSEAELHVSGNDGPIEEGDLPWGEHLVDECFTQNWHAHQTWRGGGSITGTVDGVDPNTLFRPAIEPFVGRGVFTILIASHGDCT